MDELLDEERPAAYVYRFLLTSSSIGYRDVVQRHKDICSATPGIVLWPGLYFVQVHVL